MRYVGLHVVIFITLLVLVSALPALAQQATVQGVVMDSSGASIPAAKITVRNVSTGVVSSAETNTEGFYSIPFLVPGPYEVAATASGFSPQTQTNLRLDVNMTARVDFRLAPGAVAETIEVSASAALLNTETTIVGQVIDNRRIVELPLNGRNYLELAQLTTGVVPGRGSRSADKGNFSALGARTYQTNILLDGVDNNTRASGGQLGFEAQNVTPSVDAVQEFKVVTNNNSAEYGFRMGATVLVQTKSGTNDLHGSAYEFLRNDKMDATNFFANRAGAEKPLFKRNQFGATAGGRIIRDRTFFFGSFEGTRLRRGESSTATVPTAARRAGNFSDSEALPIFDPRTTRTEGNRTVRTAFPGNLIPADRFDPVAKAVIDMYPLPNLPGETNNFFFSGTAKADTNQYDGRLDHALTDSNRVFFRYSRREFDDVDPGPLPLPADGGLWTITNLISDSYVGNWTAVVTPSSSNELRFGYTDTDSVLDIPWEENLSEQLGIRGIPPLGDDNARGMTRFTPTGYAEIGARSFWPNRNNLDLMHISNLFSNVRGRHVLKAGAEFRREAIFRRAARLARGQMAFNRSFTEDPNNRGRTGDGLADMLLGLASGGQIGNQNGEHAFTRGYSLFFQDDWKVNNRLTLNLGVRWDRFGPPSFKDSAVSRFEIDFANRQYTIVRPEDESDCGCEHDNDNFAPRVGLALQVTPKTVVRSGYGIYYGQPDSVSHDGDARFANLPPEFSEFSFPTDRLFQPALVVRDGFPTGLLPATTVQQNVAVKTALTFMPAQYASQWFFDVQRELPFDSVVTLSYIGTSSKHMVWTRNLNQPRTPAAGAVQQRRPYPFFGGITLRDPGGSASYNAFTAKGEKRFSRGLSFLLSYTWAHAIDDGAGTLNDGAGSFRDHYNTRLERGNSQYDLRHNFVASFVYDLPFGRGRAYGSQMHPVANAILGGWQLGGILFMRSGEPFSVTVSGDIANMGAANYANRVGNGNLPSGERTIDRWFDTTAFEVPAQFTIGNAGRNILYGPGSVSMDLKVGKNWMIAERLRLEYRLEMFNFTNTPNFGTPNGTLNNAQVARITSAADPRRVQMGLKVVF
jgi:outer membrane receptor protein involved in Fe transport